MSTATAKNQAWLDERVPALLDEYEVPGGVVGVLSEGGIAESAAGVLNRRTGVAATTDSIFQVGSVTKLWTATLVLQLVEEAALDLDAPVRSYLPEFQVADAAVAERSTVRQLLCHTSGIYGDAFVPTTRGDDAVQQYVETVVPGLVQDIAPDAGFSYSNSGYVVLGRIAEVLRGKPFHTLLRQRVAEPLGLRQWAAIPEEALLHRVALGHVTSARGEEPQPASFWNLPAALGPSGTMLSMSAHDLLVFGQSFADGEHRLLREDTVDLAWSPQIKLPDLGVLADEWGLGWMLLDWPGGPVVGHDGGTLGQTCMFRLVPEAGVAVVSMANGDRAMGFHQHVLTELLAENAGVEVPPLPRPPEDPAPADTAVFAGDFASPTTRTEITVDEDGTAWSVDQALTPEAALLVDEKPARLVRSDDATLISTEQTHGVHRVYRFLGGEDGGPPTHLFRDGRLIPRAD